MNSTLRIAGIGRHHGASASGFLNYAPVVIDHTKVGSSDSTNFPMLFAGTYPFLATVANGGGVQNSNGYDIAFSTDSAGTMLIPFELVNYVAATGQVEFWVSIPTLSHTTDTTIYVQFNKAVITTNHSNLAGVWGSAYKAVYHLGDGGTISLADSSQSGNTLTNHSATAVSGQIGGGVGLNGSGEWLTNASPSGLPSGDTSPIAMECWFQLNNYSSAAEILGFGNNSGGANRLALFVASGGLGVETGGDSGVFFTWTGADNNWHHAVFVLPSGDTACNQVIFYLDGVSKGTGGSGSNFTLPSSSLAITIGAIPTAESAGYWTNGSVDEVRIGAYAPSADWVTAEFNNQSSPSTFYSVPQYSYYKTITIDHTKVPADQTNFPVLVSGVYSYLATVANSGNVVNANGYDIILSSTSTLDGSGKLDFEVESYDPVTGTVNIWVKVPTLSSSADTVIYLLYGNPAVFADQSNKNATWDSNFTQVNHMNQASSAEILDSTSNGNNSTSNNGTSISGPWGKALQFVSASSQCAEFPAPFSSVAYMTFSTWIKLPNTSNYGIGYEARNGSYFGVLLYTLITSGYASEYVNQPSANTSANGAVAADGTWHYIAVTADGTDLNLYVDANAVVASGFTTTPLIDWGIGRVAQDNGGSFYNGSNKELRVSNIARSANWLLTEYYNQSSPSTFYSVA